MDFLKKMVNAPTSIAAAAHAAPTVTLVKAIHPYYPTSIEILNFVANDQNTVELLAQFTALCAIILGSAWFLMSKIAPRLRTVDRWIATWFILCGFIHSFFEGYFAYNHARMGSVQDLFGQLWKEYAMSDSRYLTSDPFVLCMETVTAACWGPLSFLMVYYIVVSHPLRHPLQIIISLGQLYGDVLYFATSMFDHYHKGVTYSRPEMFYFWGYYFFMNFIWIVIPTLLIASSMNWTARAFRALDSISRAVQGNGAVSNPQANGHPKHA